MFGKKLLSTREAAEYLGLTPYIMKRYRYNGGGPRYITNSPEIDEETKKPKRGMPRYAVDDLDAWIGEQPTYGSVAEEGVNFRQ